MRIELEQADIEDAVKEYVAKRHPSLKITEDALDWWDGNDELNETLSVYVTVHDSPVTPPKK